MLAYLPTILLIIVTDLTYVAYRRTETKEDRNTSLFGMWFLLFLGSMLFPSYAKSITVMKIALYTFTCAIGSLISVCFLVVILNAVFPTRKVWLTHCQALFLKPVVTSGGKHLTINLSISITESEFKSVATQIYAAVENCVKRCRAWPYKLRYNWKYLRPKHNATLISGIQLTPLPYPEP